MSIKIGTLAFSPGRAAMIVLLAALLVAPGCGSGPEKAEVSGSVSFDGQLVESGTIELFPIDGTAGPATGSVIRAGKYEIDAARGPLVGGVYHPRVYFPAIPAKGEVSNVSQVLKNDYCRDTRVSVGVNGCRRRA